jgi:hypothetical protein
MMMARVAWYLLVVFVLGLYTACSRAPATPEDEIRQLISKLEDAAEEKDIGVLQKHISESYSDEEDRDKNTLKGIFAYYFLQNRSIHLLTRVESVVLSHPDAAEISVYAAMAGTRIANAAILPKISADLYRFDGNLKKEGDGTWRLVEASWHPATTEDFR